MENLRAVTVTLMTYLKLLLNKNRTCNTPTVTPKVVTTIPLTITGIPTTSLGGFTRTCQSVRNVHSQTRTSVTGTMRTRGFAVSQFGTVTSNVVNRRPRALDTGRRLRFSATLKQVVAVHRTTRTSVRSTVGGTKLATSQFGRVLRRSSRSRTLCGHVNRTVGNGT